MGSVRLVNGGSPCAGTVELYHDGRWGAVFDYGYPGYPGWGMEEAAVVCKELGCGPVLSAPGTAHYGRGSGSIVTYGVQCRGSEAGLRECVSYPWRHYYNIRRKYIVSVTCSGSLHEPTISLKPDSRVLMRGEIAEISCSGNHHGSNFSLYRDGEFITLQASPENDNTATFTALNITAGNYWCKYTTHIGGREFTSPESERLGISVQGSWNMMKIINSVRISLAIAVQLVTILLVVLEC